MDWAEARPSLRTTSFFSTHYVSAFFSTAVLCVAACSVTVEEGAT